MIPRPKVCLAQTVRHIAKANIHSIPQSTYRNHIDLRTIILAQRHYATRQPTHPESVITPSSPPSSTQKPPHAENVITPASPPPPPPEPDHAESVITPASPPRRTLRAQIDPLIPPPHAPKRKRPLGPILLAAVSLMIGLTAGQWMRYTISPPVLPAPGEGVDAQLSSYIRSKGEALPIVHQLENDPAWRSYDAYSSFNTEEKKKRITTGPLAGARGIGGYQRIFHNASTGEFISVIYIGGALAGFPGVCHGGLIATILDESLGRCAISKFPTRTGVTANLELSYKAPVLTNSFYVVRTLPVDEGRTDRKSFARATVEGLDGRVLVEAKALFVLPKNVTLRGLGEEF